MTGARPEKSVVAMRRPTLADVPAMPILPATTILRRARVEDAEALAALLGRAYASERWDATGTEREMFGDETIRATLVVDAEGRLIATASLQVRPDAPERGVVRWVATEEDRRREGLARALVIGVLALARQAGCREALLHSESDRLAAIALYLQLGFEPVVTNEAEHEVWKQVNRSLRADAAYRFTMPIPNTRLALAWAALTGAFALHVWDEAAHDFLAMYNPVAASLRARLGPVPFPPVFTYRTWLTALLCALVLLLALVPVVRRGGRWVVPAAYMYAAVHVVNGMAHIVIALALGRLAPGVWSAPLLLVTASWLVWEARAVTLGRMAVVRDSDTRLPSTRDPGHQ